MGKVKAPNDRFSLKAPHKAAQGLHKALHKALIPPTTFSGKLLVNDHQMKTSSGEAHKAPAQGSAQGSCTRLPHKVLHKDSHKVAKPCAHKAGLMRTRFFVSATQYHYGKL